MCNNKLKEAWRTDMAEMVFYARVSFLYCLIYSEYFTWRFELAIYTTNAAENNNTKVSVRGMPNAIKKLWVENISGKISLIQIPHAERTFLRFKITTGNALNLNI